MEDGGREKRRGRSRKRTVELILSEEIYLFPFCPFLLPITHHQSLMEPIKFCCRVEALFRKRAREVSGGEVLQCLIEGEGGVC